MNTRPSGLRIATYLTDAARLHPGSERLPKSIFEWLILVLVLILGVEINNFNCWLVNRGAWARRNRPSSQTRDMEKPLHFDRRRFTGGPVSGRTE